MKKILPGKGVLSSHILSGGILSALSEIVSFITYNIVDGTDNVVDGTDNVVITEVQ